MRWIRPLEDELQETTDANLAAIDDEVNAQPTARTGAGVGSRRPDYLHFAFEK